ncbi:MAG: C4-dicarboxylate ABC transporter [Betaproteobacteria bacterium]|nr:C4-dicarboxylate ABC transporter [Betaproteobacteria bacterium]
MNASSPPVPVSFPLIVKTFAPGWPAAVMGTGAFALTTLHFSHQVPVLAGPAWALHWFNLALFAAISVPWLLRWIMAWPAVAMSFKHPVAANFYPSYAIALLVLAGELRSFGGHESLALAAWWIGVVLLFGLTLSVLISILQGEHVNLDHITPGIFIPPVGLVIIPVAGAPLLTSQPEAWRDLALTINAIGLGSGVIMYLALLALAFHRFYVHKRLPPTMAPTFWINLAPVGITVVSVLNLTAATPFAGDRASYLMAMFLLWGFGAFWLVLSILFTWSVRKIAPLPFSLAWWAFTFPLGAFALGSQRLAEATGLATPLAFGWLAWLLLVGIWSLTLVKTIVGVASGKLFQPHP